MKIHQVGTEMFHVQGHADGQRNVTKPKVASRKFANAPKTTLIKL